jgi:iron complex outermembrane receptor protein
LGQPYETDSFFTIDAKIGYESEHYVAAINVKNLTGEKYFVPYNYFNGRVAPGEDRAVYGTLKYRY